MLEYAKETTAPIPSDATDGEQPFTQKCKSSIADDFGENKTNDELETLYRRMRQLSDPNYLNAVSMTELYDRCFKQRPPIIERLLNSGTYLFVGAPKVGKSFLMAQLGYHISSGLSLWGYPVHQSPVLYLALEDTLPRLQKRLMRMFGTEENGNLYFSTFAKVLTQGLEQQLEWFLNKHPRTGLIIIDTLQKVRELEGEKFSYASDYEIVSKLKAFCDTKNLCLLLVHHTRKQGAQDAFDTISGTNGLLGAADGAFILHKDKRTGNDAVLEVTGRDQPDMRLHLSFDRDTCLWNLESTEQELWKEPADPILEAVAGVVTADAPEWEGTATDLGFRLQEVNSALDIQPNALTRRLNVYGDRLKAEYGVAYRNIRKGNLHHII
ncbi:MAG: AAA family ATPase, partial [Clostridia bacterium]|nr:AAA family ATPase [Clostridia bacterium]